METSKPRELGKGTRFPFQVSIALWGDLLGYGANMAEAEFNPIDEKAKKSVTRLRTFHRIVAQNSFRLFPTLVVNDGVAAYRDLSLPSQSAGLDFLRRAWSLFQAVTGEENRSHFPGMRMVVACGFRMLGRRPRVERGHTKLKSILRRFKQGKLTHDQAIHEAFAARPSFDIVPQLQGNFAFTKAYVAESSGTTGSLGGPNFYLDLSLLHHPLSSWLVFHDTVFWRHDTLGLDTRFGRVKDIPVFSHDLRGGATPVRNGLQVAQALVGHTDVLEALRNAKKP